MPEFTRRRFVGGAAAATAAGAAATFMPPAVQKALAAPPSRPGKLSDIKHVVLLMQENRSFDHYFGTLSGVAGFDDPHAITLASTGQKVFFQPDSVNPDGYTLPFHLDTHSTNAQHIPSTSHAWEVQHQAWNGGAMDNWMPAHRAADQANGPYVMGYYTREDIPFQYALADAFTICDHYHCSVLASTWPNRLYWQTGMIDPAGGNGGPILDTGEEPDGAYRWTTYAERLQAAGVTWKDYHYGTGLVGDGMLPFFQNFQDAQPGDPLYERGVKLTEVGEFEYDVLHNQLATVSWLAPPAGASEHPGEPSNIPAPAQGAAFVSSVISALASNPEVWASTVMILNYDENDGQFDHVVPPTAPAGTPGEFITGTLPASAGGITGPIGAGFRVPCIIISPWSAGGYVSSEVFDHTSVLRFLEKVTGVMEPNISAWRRQTFGDLTGTLHFGRPARPQVIADTGANLQLATYELNNLPAPALPGATQTVPHQEKGKRPRV